MLNLNFSIFLILAKHLKSFTVNEKLSTHTSCKINVFFFLFSLGWEHSRK